MTELTALSQNLKQTRYEYELISGNLTKTIYQEGQPDQFIHTYDYDDNNRLFREYTSHAGERKVVKLYRSLQKNYQWLY